MLELILEIIGNIMKSTRKKKIRQLVCYQVVRTKECVAVSQPKQHEATIIIAFRQFSLTVSYTSELREAPGNVISCAGMYIINTTTSQRLNLDD